MLMIRDFMPSDADAVIDLILGIQQGEFRVPVTLADQPDLLMIPQTYQAAGGFWVGEDDGTVVGTIGLLHVGERLGVIRKMFVAASHRGGQPSLAQGLLEHLIAEAHDAGLDTLMLGTVPQLRAAHRFYERNGFAPVAETDLPAHFPRMPVDTLFYRRVIA